MFLKDSPVHLEAFKAARDKSLEFEPIYETFFYITELLKSGDTSLVNTTYQPHTRNAGVLISYKYPFEACDVDNDCLETEDIPLEDTMFEIITHSIMNQKKAAEYCGVTRRTIQRWESEGLKSWKIGTQKFYEEDHLIEFKRQMGKI